MNYFFAESARFFNRRFFIFVGAYALFLIGVVAAAEAVEGRGWFALLDYATLAHIVAARTNALTYAMQVITAFGNGVTVWLLVIMTGILLSLEKKYIYAIALALSVSGASIVALAMKQVLVRPRPAMLPLVSESTFSFPSGHASLSLAFYGILIYFLLRYACAEWVRIAGAIGGIIMIAAIGFSRVYLGVHWPSDVIGGYVLVGMWLYLVITQMKHVEQQEEQIKEGRLLVGLRRSNSEAE